jgi:haloalkane dehalogenase
MITEKESGSLSPIHSQQLPAWLDETLYPFAHRFVELNGHRIHYMDEGEGPTLLFLHAVPLWSFQYRNIIKELRTRFRCVALDFPGFGLSTAARGYHNTLAGSSQLVERFIVELQLTNITLVAHDTGGAAGLDVVVRHPDWFQALVLSNGFAWPLNDYPRIYRALRFAGSPLGRFLIVNFNLFLKQTGRILAGGALSEPELQAYRGPFLGRGSRHHQHDLLRSVTDSHDYLADLNRRLRELSHLPVLLAWGDSDALYKAGLLQRFEAVFPRHHTVVIKGAGHIPHEDASDRIATAIGEWWSNEIDQG